MFPKKILKIFERKPEGISAEITGRFYSRIPGRNSQSIHGRLRAIPKKTKASPEQIQGSISRAIHARFPRRFFF